VAPTVQHVVEVFLLKTYMLSEFRRLNMFTWKRMLASVWDDAEHPDSVPTSVIDATTVPVMETLCS